MAIDYCCDKARNDREVNTRHLWSIGEVEMEVSVESMAAGLIEREGGE